MDTYTFLKCFLIGYFGPIFAWVLFNIFLIFNLPQKISGFFVYHVRARFFPDKLDELDFYADGTWGKRIDEIPISESIIRIINARNNLAKFRCRFYEQSQS